MLLALLTGHHYFLQFLLYHIPRKSLASELSVQFVIFNTQKGFFFFLNLFVSGCEVFRNSSVGILKCHSKWKEITMEMEIRHIHHK